MTGPRPTSSVLKLIRGDSHRDRLKQDKPKIAGAPVVPPGIALSVAESEMWAYLIEHVYQPGVHSTGDGAAFCKVARLWARVNEIDEQVRAFGIASKNPASSKMELQPYARMSRDLWQQLGIALSEVGATPSGRVRMAAPLGDGVGGGSSWEGID
jgi:phage terminase small subunit